MTAHDGTTTRDHDARRLLACVRLRAALHEAVGIVQVRQACTAHQATADLHRHHDHDAEAARVIATVDADACGRSDPDAGWD